MDTTNESRSTPSLRLLDALETKLRDYSDDMSSGCFFALDSAIDAVRESLSPPALEGAPVLSPDSDVWTSLEIILASGQVLKRDNPLMATDIIGNVQQIVAALEPLTIAAPAPAQQVSDEMVARLADHLGRRGGPLQSYNLAAQRDKAREYLTAALQPPTAQEASNGG